MRILTCRRLLHLKTRYLEIKQLTIEITLVLLLRLNKVPLLKMYSIFNVQTVQTHTN